MVLCHKFVTKYVYIWLGVFRGQTQEAVVIFIPTIEQRLLLLHHQSSTEAVDPDWLRDPSEELLLVLKHVSREVGGPLPHVLPLEREVLDQLLWTSIPVSITNI